MKEQNKGRILIILCALLWGLAGVCVKSIPWNPFSIMAVRSTISFLIILISRRSLKVKLTKKTFFGTMAESPSKTLLRITNRQNPSPAACPPL